MQWKKRQESLVGSRESEEPKKSIRHLVKKSSAINEKSATNKENNKIKTIVETSPTAGGGRGVKELKKELQKQQRIFLQSEEKLAALNKQKSALEAALSDPATYADKGKFLQAETAYKKAASELEQLNKQYEQVFEKIVALESQLS